MSKSMVLCYSSSANLTHCWSLARCLRLLPFFAPGLTSLKMLLAESSQQRSLSVSPGTSVGPPSPAPLARRAAACRSLQFQMALVP